MAELYSLNPLFSGSSELDQLYKIMGVMGTPAPSIWPEGYKLASQIGILFPRANATPLEKLIPGVCPEGYELLY
jgi:protein kinase